MCVCLNVSSVVCRPPSHWSDQLHILHNYRSWPFVGWTSMSLGETRTDPDRGNNNKKLIWRNRAKYPRHRYSPQNSICGTVVQIPVHVSIKYDVNVVCDCSVHAVVVCLICVSSVQCSVRFNDTTDTVMYQCFDKWNGLCAVPVPVTWRGHENELGSAVKFKSLSRHARFLDFKLKLYMMPLEERTYRERVRSS